MPLDLGQSLPTVDSTVVQIDVKLEQYDTSIKVWFDPVKYDAKIEFMLGQARSIPAQAINEFITTFVTDWELDFNGERIPPTKQGLDDYRQQLHFLYVLTPIASAILEKLTEGKAPKPNLPTRLPTVRAQQKR